MIPLAMLSFSRCLSNCCMKYKNFCLACFVHVTAEVPFSITFISSLLFMKKFEEKIVLKVLFKSNQLMITWSKIKSPKSIK